LERKLLDATNGVLREIKKTCFGGVQGRTDRSLEKKEKKRSEEEDESRREFWESDL
jgi:hypothetical protein